MRTIEDRIPGAGALLVLLHGAGDRAEHFARHGLIADVRARAWAVDIVAVDAHADNYLDKSVITRLHQEVIAPELAARPRPLWIAGISLGGMGACLYARAHPGAVTGLLLLAPFLAVRGTIAEVTRAGGLAAWQPGAIAPDDDERLLLRWLKEWQAGTGPDIWLGYGTNDRYAPASALLAARLAPERVLTQPGGHDWPTWQALWPCLLDRLVAR